jgi:hypothetical protein
MFQPIAPRDEREKNLIEVYERDLRQKWDVNVGPLIRRNSDGKLIRMPDRTSPTRTDPQVATDAFVLGRGPGREHGVIYYWIECAQTFATWPQPDREAALITALRNEAVYFRNLATNPPAPEDAHKFGIVVQPPTAVTHRPLLSYVDAEKAGKAAPDAPVRTTAPVRHRSRVLAAEDA